MNFTKYHENLSKLHVGTMDRHAYFIPASTMELASKDRKYSDRFFSLNGEWAFKYFDTDRELPEGFFEEDFDIDSMDVLPVPSCWQMYGYDSHNYTNVRYAIPFDPPYVPAKNPCGIYIRDFDVVNDGMDMQLVFEGVDSCLYLWINGAFVGYSQVSHASSEFDISKYVKEGSNRICVLVYKWCDGTYLEDQDKLRMSGIFRDVYVLERPKKRIEDFFIRESFQKDYKKAGLEIEFKIKKVKNIKVYLLDDEGECVASGEVNPAAGDKDCTLALEVKSPKLWNAENPYLYTLYIETPDEVIARPLGLRDVCVKDRVIYVNGQKIKFKGVNRHDSSAFNGYAVTEDEMYQDITMIKAHNFNAIRTSHYPNSPLFIEMCDRVGLYVIGESDVEIHGVVMLYGGGYEKSYALLADDPKWKEPILDRIKANVMRDKNATSILIWSLGNEAGFGGNFENAAKWVREYDDSRLIHYEGAMWRGSIGADDENPILFEHSKYDRKDGKYDFSNLDMYSQMYPSLEHMADYSKNGDKPMLLCEYSHAMGNGPGCNEDYWKFIYDHEEMAGAFVWEWCDHSIYMGQTPEGKDKFFYGGDWNDKLNDGNFCMDGLVYPDRTPHTGLLEVSQVIRPIRLISVKNGVATLKNMLDFTDVSKKYDILVRVLKEGNVVFECNADVPKTKPHGNFKIDIPYEISDEDSILFVYVNSDEDAPEYMSECVGFDQYIIADAAPKASEIFKESSVALKKNDISVYEGDDEIVVEGKNFRYVFDRDTAAFTDLVNKNVSYILKPTETSVWRAPTDNDGAISNKWRDAGFDRTLIRVYETKATVKEDRVIIKAKYALNAIGLQNFLKVTAEYSINKDGDILVSLNGDRLSVAPFLPRFGIRLFLKKNMEQVSYYGYGPYESYVDKRRASWLDRFEDSVSELFENYVKPQENGSHYGCSDLMLFNKNGECIKVKGENFSFNASHYTVEELTKAKHNYELCESDYTVLHIDGAMAGIGSNSCGPELKEEYRTPDKLSLNVVLEFSHLGE